MNITVLPFFWVTLFGGSFFMIIYLIVSVIRHEIIQQKKCNKEAREEMLRILSKTTPEEFKEVIKKLGWVRRRADNNWQMVLPQKDFATTYLIGSTVGLIVKNQELWWAKNVFGSVLENLAQEINKTYESQTDINNFLEGMKTGVENPEDTVRLEGLIKEAQGEEMGIKGRQERKDIILAGLKASGVK